MKLALTSLMLILLISGCDQSEETPADANEVESIVEKEAQGEATPKYKKVTEEEKKAHLDSIKVEETLNPDLGKEQANVAVNLFNQTCVKNIKKPDERIAYLDSNYTRHEGAGKDLFLGLFRVKSGNSWAAVFSKGIYAIVVDDNGNCHVAALYADDEQIHSNIENIYNDLKALPSKPNIKYHAFSKGTLLDTSGFDFLGSDSEAETAIVVSTHPNPPEGKPAALLTMDVVAP